MMGSQIHLCVERRRNIGFVVSPLGNRPIDIYSSSEADSVRDKWI